MSGEPDRMSEASMCRCESCGHVAWPPRLLCPACGSPDFAAIRAGRGVVRERTEVVSPAGEPVALVTVALDSGPWVLARTTDARPGDAVTLALGDDGALEAVR